jgi:hypothetical protein
MIRNTVIVLVILAGWAWTAVLDEGSHAQQATAPRRVGVVAPAFSADSDAARAFREGLRVGGYVDGRDLSIDWWYGHGSYKGVKDAVGTFVRTRVDVIVV